MQKLIIIKYGELTTKKDNINFFLKALKKNVEDALSNIDHTTTYDASRMFIKTTDFDKTIEKLKCDLALPESSDKTFSPLNDYLKLYRALVPCCLKWVDQYEEVWKKVECDPIYQEMTEKLK